MNVLKSLKSFFDSSKRVLLVSKKPDAKEYSMMAKITGIGILVIGFIGFTITFFMRILGIGF